MTKPLSGKNITCTFCAKEFYVPKNRLETAKYCSRSCKAKATTIQITAKCEICLNQFTHICSRSNKAKYCSRSCYYKAQHLKGTVNYSCTHCNKNFKGSPSKPRKYCSRACIGKSKKKIWNPSFSTARKNLLARGRITKCNRCGFDSHPEILGVHHKDRDRSNNEISNLEILCPNCHSLEHSKHICHSSP